MGSKLIEVVENLELFDRDFTIYVAKPWSCDSESLVAREPEQGGVPFEAESIGAVYFLEVSIAKELVEDWKAAKGESESERDVCKRLIQYASRDA